MNKRAVEKDNNEEKTKLQVKYQNVNPTFVDMMLYSYCYAGLLTGTGSEYVSMLVRDELFSFFHSYCLAI